MHVSIVSTLILDEHDQLERELNNEQIARKYQDDEAKQIAEEKALIANTQICDTETLKSIRERLTNLDEEKLKDDISNKFYNQAVMEAAACTIESITYVPPNGTGSLYHNDLIRQYITNLKQIGSESVSGYALLGDFDGIKGMFIEKVSRDADNDGLLHELIVGLYGTNKTRNYIPNFAYIYGGFRCSPPVIDPETKQLTSWCLDNNNAVNYVLYENVAPSVSMRDYLETCSGQDFLNIYMQVLYSLKLGHKLFDFTHYDLHSENILIRDHKIHHQSRPFQIHYETENGMEYITATKIATFIDYGYSHIQHDGKHFGLFGLVPYFTYPDRSWIMHDAYKFLMFCMEDSMRKNHGVFNEAAKIFRYFNQIEDPVRAIELQMAINFSFPLTNETAQLNIDDLARHIRSVCDCSFISPILSNDHILECEGVCPTERDILNRIGLDPDGKIPVPDDILDFFDLISLLRIEGNEVDEERIIDQFDYENVMRNYLDMVDDKVKELNTLSYELGERLDLLSVNDVDLNNYDQLNKVKSVYALVAKIVDMVFEISHYKDVGVDIAELYADIDSANVLNDTMPSVHEIVDQVLDDALLVLQDNYRFLNNFMKGQIDDFFTNRSIKRSDISDKEVIRLIEAENDRDRRLRWYWRGRETFDTHFIKLINDILTH